MRTTPIPAPSPSGNRPQALRLLRWTLLLLVLELTFEGLARKMNVKGMNIAIFLLKDIIVAAMGVQVVRLRRSKAIEFLWSAYLVEIVLFVPVILATAYHDPILAVFGAKEYLLYPVVAFGVFLGFEDSNVAEIVRFFRWLALLIIPTALVAILQLRLPPTHWLNLSVDGNSLEGFAAAGHLRVSSTFPFVAQYSAFIDAEVFITMIALNTLKGVNFFWKVIFLSLIPFLILSSYVTGSRGAVLSCCLTVVLACGLLMMKFQARSAIRLMFIIGALLVTLGVTRFVFPEAFEAYSEREEGHLLGAGNEVQQRIYSSLLDWTQDISTTPVLGNGLGLMSNGSDMLSSYAAGIRFETWTETDIATTLFEGGLYLIFVWYLFRLYVIYQVFLKFLGLKGQELALPGAFSVAFCIITGLVGTLAIQPPIAIWWWLSVGASIVLCQKSLAPQDGLPPSDPGPTAAAAKPKLRGRSEYAERLHAQGK